MKKIFLSTLGILFGPFLYLSAIFIIEDIDRIGFINFLGYTIVIIIITAYLLDSFKNRDRSFYILFFVFVEVMIMDFVYVNHEYLHW